MILQSPSLTTLITGWPKSYIDGYFAQVWPPTRFLCRSGFQRFTILMRSDAALRKFQTTWRVIKD